MMAYKETSNEYHEEFDDKRKSGDDSIRMEVPAEDEIFNYATPNTTNNVNNVLHEEARAVGLGIREMGDNLASRAISKVIGESYRKAGDTVNNDKILSNEALVNKASSNKTLTNVKKSSNDNIGKAVVSYSSDYTGMFVKAVGDDVNNSSRVSKLHNGGFLKKSLRKIRRRTEVPVEKKRLIVESAVDDNAINSVSDIGRSRYFRRSISRSNSRNL